MSLSRTDVTLDVTVRDMEKSRKGRPAHFPLYCAICGIIGADIIAWVWPAHGRREDGLMAPVHERCLDGG